MRFRRLVFKQTKVFVQEYFITGDHKFNKHTMWSTSQYTEVSYEMPIKAHSIKIYKPITILNQDTYKMFKRVNKYEKKKLTVLYINKFCCHKKHNSVRKINPI